MWIGKNIHILDSTFYTQLIDAPCYDHLSRFHLQYTYREYFVTYSAVENNHKLWKQSYYLRSFLASFAKTEFCEGWSKDKWFLGNAFSGVELRTKSKHFDYSNWSPISSFCSLLACLHFMDLGTRMYIIYISYTCSLYTTHLYKTKLPMINYILNKMLSTNPKNPENVEHGFFWTFTSGFVLTFFNAFVNMWYKLQSPAHT